MSDYIISCCSTADLTKEHFESRQINYICFHYELDGKEYVDDLGQSMDFHEFYRAMANGATTKTSQVNADEFIEYFTPFLEQGKDILHVTLSSGISGVHNSAMVAKQDLEERFPERKIFIVDSLGASSGYGLIMDKLADLRDGGMGLEELYRRGRCRAGSEVPQVGPGICQPHPAHHRAGHLRHGLLSEAVFPRPQASLVLC